MKDIIKTIDKTVKKYNMLSNGDFVVVAVSGGADSILLLHYFVSKREELHLKLLVANVEHGIRGEESIEDTLFVKDFCKKNNVEFHYLSINAVKEAKENGLGIEEYSRKRRYEFFNSFNADKIATAHNLSDNVETVLFRMSRGTSIKGLCGIPAKRDNIIRPLIELSSEDIRKYLNDNNIPYRIDSTNSDNEYSRNRIRNVIIPELKEINSSVEKNISKLIESASEDDVFLQEYSNKIYEKSIFENSLSIEELKNESKSIKKRVIIKYFDKYNISFDEKHLSQVVDLINHQGKVQIKGNYFAISDKKYLRFAEFHKNKDFSSLIVNKKIITSKEFLTNCELFTKQFDFYCDYDKIDGEIIIRQRRQGDIISLQKRNCTKSIKKLFNELHIDVEKRDNIPLLCDNKGVFGVYGYCVDKRVQICDNTKNIVLIKILSEDKY